MNDMNLKNKNNKHKILASLKSHTLKQIKCKKKN